MRKVFNRKTDEMKLKALVREEKRDKHGLTLCHISSLEQTG